MIKAAVLGKPVSHSLSPFVHGQIYQKLGLEYSYERIEHDEVSAIAFIQDAIASGEWNGFSLTMPLKEVVFALELPCDSYSISAHSVNTITGGRGYNTDVSGMVRVLEELSVSFRKIAIIGSGATARSALVALGQLSGRGETIGAVDIFRRSSHRDALLQKASRNQLTFHGLDQTWNRSDYDLVISTIPSSAQSKISFHLQGYEGTLLDVTYSPWPSTFAGVVKGRVISGLPLLVAQAVDQAALFTGLDFDRDAMYQEMKISTAREASK